MDNLDTEVVRVIGGGNSNSSDSSDSRGSDSDHGDSYSDSDSDHGDSYSDSDSVSDSGDSGSDSYESRGTDTYESDNSDIGDSDPLASMSRLSLSDNTYESAHNSPWGSINDGRSAFKQYEKEGYIYPTSEDTERNAKGLDMYTILGNFNDMPGNMKDLYTEGVPVHNDNIPQVHRETIKEHGMEATTSGGANCDTIFSTKWDNNSDNTGYGKPNSQTIQPFPHQYMSMHAFRYIMDAYDKNGKKKKDVKLSRHPRGLLLYHSLGSGKTLTTSMILDTCLDDKFKDWDVFLLSTMENLSNNSPGALLKDTIAGSSRNLRTSNHPDTWEQDARDRFKEIHNIDVCVTDANQKRKDQGENGYCMATTIQEFCKKMFPRYGKIWDGYSTKSLEDSARDSGDRIRGSLQKDFNWAIGLQNAKAYSRGGRGGGDWPLAFLPKIRENSAWYQETENKIRKYGTLEKLRGAVHSDEYIHRPLQKTILILDESHSLFETTNPQEQTYADILAAHIKREPECVVVMLSATPGGKDANIKSVMTLLQILATPPHGPVSNSARTAREQDNELLDELEGSADDTKLSRYILNRKIMISYVNSAHNRNLFPVENCHDKAGGPGRAVDENGMCTFGNDNDKHHRHDIPMTPKVRSALTRIINENDPIPVGNSQLRSISKLLQNLVGKGNFDRTHEMSTWKNNMLFKMRVASSTGLVWKEEWNPTAGVTRDDDADDDTLTDPRSLRDLMHDISTHKFDVIQEAIAKNKHDKHLIVVDAGRTHDPSLKYATGNPVISALRAYLISKGYEHFEFDHRSEETPDIFNNNDTQYSKGFVFKKSRDKIIYEKIDNEPFISALSIRMDDHLKHKGHFCILDTDDKRVINTELHIKSMKKVFNDFIYNLGSLNRKGTIKGELQTFNNIYPPPLRVMITTRTEGIDLKGVKHIHFLESPLMLKDYYQAIGRTIRTCSFFGIPNDEWFVQVHEYFTHDHRKTDSIKHELHEARMELFRNHGIDMLKDDHPMLEGMDSRVHRLIRRYAKLRENYIQNQPHGIDRMKPIRKEPSMNIQINKEHVLKWWLETYYARNRLRMYTGDYEQRNERRGRTIRRRKNKIKTLTEKATRQDQEVVQDCTLKTALPTESERNEVRRRVNLKIHRNARGFDMLSYLPEDWVTKIPKNISIFTHITEHKSRPTTTLNVDDTVRKISILKYREWREIQKTLVETSFDCTYNQVWNKNDIPTLMCKT